MRGWLVEWVRRAGPIRVGLRLALSRGRRCRTEGYLQYREGAFAVRYILTIKALHELDPTGLTLSAIGDPIRKYLRERRDTVRCIVEGACRVLPPRSPANRPPPLRCMLGWAGTNGHTDRASQMLHVARANVAVGLAVRLPGLTDSTSDLYEELRRSDSALQVAPLPHRTPYTSVPGTTGTLQGSVRATREYQ